MRSAAQASYLFFLLLTVAAVDARTTATVNSSVVDFDAGGLVTALATQSVVVEFHTTWCALCKSYAPEFDRVAAAFEGKRADRGEPLVFGRVDVDAHKEVAVSFGVRNVPFVAVLRWGVWFEHDAQTGEPVPLPPERYDGPLAAGATVEWVSNRTGIPVSWRQQVEELTPEGLAAAMEQDEQHDVLVQFYGASCGRCQEFEPQYKQVASYFAGVEHVRVARIDVNEHRHLVAAFNLTGVPSFILFPRGMHKRRGLPFTGPRSAVALIEFVASPAVASLTADVQRRAGICMVDLHQRGVVQPWQSHTTVDERAQAVLFAAHAAAEGGMWRDALEVLLCLSATPSLRNTGTGSAPAVWNLLDNAKLHVEREALSQLGLAAPEEQTVEDEAGPHVVGLDSELLPGSDAPSGTRPEDDKWEMFAQLAAEKHGEL